MTIHRYFFVLNALVGTQHIASADKSRAEPQSLQVKYR